ncbi:MAG: hypothetical protein ACK5LZ_01595 [Anaerorhabdus sp.]
MKGVIQIYGMLIIFSFAVILLPQIIHYAILYNQGNMAVLRVVELIEVYGGFNSMVEDSVNQLEDKYKRLKLSVDVQSIDRGFIYYQVDGNRIWEIKLLQLEIEINNKKRTKRMKGELK